MGCISDFSLENYSMTLLTKFSTKELLVLLSVDVGTSRGFLSCLVGYICCKLFNSGILCIVSTGVCNCITNVPLNDTQENKSFPQ